MVNIQSPQLKNTPSSVAAPKLKAANSVGLTAEAVKPTVPSSSEDAPVRRAKAKKVDGAFGKETVKAAPKTKVKVTHNEKMAARKQLKKDSKLKKKEELKAAKKLAKKAKRTALRNAMKRKTVGRNVTKERE